MHYNVQILLNLLDISLTFHQMTLLSSANVIRFCFMQVGGVA